MNIGLGYRVLNESETRLVGVNTFYDYGFKRHHVRWARAYGEGYHWDFKHHDDQNGFKVGTELQVTPNISVDAGYNKSIHHSGDAYGKIMYTLGKIDFALFGGKHSDDSVSTVRSKMLDKVRRNNNIVVERYQKNAPTVQSDTVTFSVRVR